MRMLEDLTQLFQFHQEMYHASQNNFQWQSQSQENVYVSVFQYVHVCTSQTIQTIGTAVLSEYQRL